VLLKNRNTFKVLLLKKVNMAALPFYLKKFFTNTLQAFEQNEQKIKPLADIYEKCVCDIGNPFFMLRWSLTVSSNDNRIKIINDFIKKMELENKKTQKQEPSFSRKKKYKDRVHEAWIEQDRKEKEAIADFFPGMKISLPSEYPINAFKSSSNSEKKENLSSHHNYSTRSKCSVNVPEITHTPLQKKGNRNGKINKSKTITTTVLHGAISKQQKRRGKLPKEDLSKLDPSQVKKCELCGYMTRKLADYKKHYNGVHLNYRPYKCDICNSSFKQNSALHQHKRLQHS